MVNTVSLNNVKKPNGLLDYLSLSVSLYNRTLETIKYLNWVILLFHKKILDHLNIMATENQKKKKTEQRRLEN